MAESCHLCNRKDQCSTVGIGSHCNRHPKKIMRIYSFGYRELGMSFYSWV